MAKVTLADMVKAIDLVDPWDKRHGECLDAVRRTLQAVEVWKSCAITVTDYYGFDSVNCANLVRNIRDFAAEEKEKP